MSCWCVLSVFWSFVYLWFRVWDGGHLLGDLTISAGVGGTGGGRRAKSRNEGEDEEGTMAGIYKHRPDSTDVPHLGCMVQALAIDKRSK